MIKRLKVINIIGFLLMIGVNVAVVTLPLNDTTTKQIANRYPNLLTPADHTFLIWIDIYFSMLLFTAYQITKSADETVASIGILYFFSALLNSAWLVLW